MAIRSSDHAIIDFENLAYLTGSPMEEVRTAGEKLFDQLAGKDADLTKALIAASTASGLKPKEVLAIVSVFAQDFRRPVPEAAAQSVGAKVAELGQVAREVLDGTSKKVRSGISNIDLEDITERGRETLREAREKVVDIELAEIGNRAKEAGSSALDSVRSLAKTVADSVGGTKVKDQDSNDNTP